MAENDNHVADSASNNNKNNKKLFPQKLWDLINDERYRFCLRWSEDGQLVYLNRDEFENKYLKTPENQFHTQKAISFVRQMNMYGFRKVDDCYYENDNFKRNCEQLLKNMIRKHPNKAGPSSAHTINHSHSHNHGHHGHHDHQIHHSNSTTDEQIARATFNLNHQHNLRQLTSNNVDLRLNQLSQNNHHHSQIKLLTAASNATTTTATENLLRRQQIPTNPNSPESLTHAASIASVLVNHQQQMARDGNDLQNALTSNGSTSMNSTDCNPTLATYAAVAAFNQHHISKLNGVSTATTSATIPSTVDNTLTKPATPQSTTTTTTPTIATNNCLQGTCGPVQIHEALLGQVRNQQSATSEDERFNCVDDESLSSLSDYCCLNGGHQSAGSSGEPSLNSNTGLGPNCNPGGTVTEIQQRCNNEVLDFTGELKHLEQDQQRQRAQFQQAQQQQQQQQVQLTAQYANLYPHGLDATLMSQFRALQAAGQMANVTNVLTNATNLNGLDASILSTTTTTNPSSAVAAAAVAAAAQQQLQQPGTNLQNNLLLNTLIALGILSITNLTQRG